MLDLRDDILEQRAKGFGWPQIAEMLRSDVFGLHVSVSRLRTLVSGKRSPRASKRSTRGMSAGAAVKAAGSVGVTAAAGKG